MEKFQLSEEELTNPKYRKGYPGYRYTAYPRNWQKDEEVPVHPNYKEHLSSYYKAGKMVGLRGDLMIALNSTLPPRKEREQVEE